MARPSMRPEEREQVRAKIIEAAEEVFAESGYGAAKVSAIARRAGLSSGTLYNYFDSKLNLFLTIFDVRSRQMLEQYTSVIDGPEPFQAKLTKLVDVLLGFIASHHLFLKIYGSITHQLQGDLQSKIHKVMKDRFLHYIDYVTRLMRFGIEEGILEPISSRDMAHFLIGIVNSLAAQLMYSLVPFDPRDKRDQVINLFLNGASNRRDRPPLTVAPPIIDP